MRSNVPCCLVIVSALVLSAPARAAEFGLEQRVAAQRAIEQVYWSHRIWPHDNPRPKPPLFDVLPDAALRAKIDDALRQSEALGAVWGRPIGRDQLQAELNRMIAQTHDAATLRELFEALGNDPALIAESLARPILAGRLIRDWYAFDARFHGELHARAEAAASACHEAACMSRLGGEYRETVLRRRDPAANPAAAPAPVDSAKSIDADAWAAELDRLARAAGGVPDHLRLLQPGALDESADAFTITAVLSQNAHEVKVATTTWAKRPFDAWWAEARRSFAPALPQLAGSFSITAPQSTLCTDDTWTAIPPEIPEPRSGHTAVWTGSEMIIWGGSSSSPYQNAGGRYAPATDSWTFTSTVGAPAPRNSNTAIWTGTRMIVWGGNAAGVTGTGGQYDPGTDSWTATSTAAPAPSARTSHSAVWTGTEMIIWGGNSGSGTLNTGARYNPGTDTWTPTSTGTNTPVARDSHSAVWTGTQMIVWGGLSGTYQNTGGRYTPGTDSWTATSTGANVPSGRIQHTAVWTGSVMIIWGGQPGPVNTGGQYNPATNTWTATSTGTNVPSAREQHTAVWTQTEMIVWGGFATSPSSTYLNTGGRYNPSTNSWIPTSTGTNTPPGRSVHTAVWTGTEMIVWGGATPSVSYTGGRYNPSTNSWVPTSTGSIVPTARFNHTAVWTGAEMIVWGGRSDAAALDSGKSYDPATASWSPIAASGAPAGRQNHTAIWTGTKMVVWGGANFDYTGFLSTGGVYDVASDVWTPTSVGPNVPSARYWHTAVWSGTEMIVWGGQASASFNTGGRYAPATDSWTPTSTGANVPSVRALHTATWTGSAMVIWGGNVFENTGGRYFPATDSWLPTSTGANVPTIGTEFSTSVWTGSRVIIWGGYDFNAVNKGVLYDPAGDAWTPTSTGANCPSARYEHNAVWTGRQMIVWGGSNDSTGGRYDPVANTWTVTSTGAGVPGRRQNASSIWSGTEMIVWGGAPTTATGGRYCACASAAPSGEATLLLGQSTPGTAHLSWTYAGTDASAFDVVRGDLSTLRSSGGDFSVATGSCLGNDAGAFVDDPSVPAAGSGYWYLIRAVSCGGRGSYGSAPADTGISASGNDCS